MPLPILSAKSHARLNAERTIDLAVYQDNGFDSRGEYIESLVQEYGIDVVRACLSVLPPNEDFDGLVTTLEDFAYIS